jgi:predicted flap endonuclease-1-like 5' DNA nuclease
MSYLLTQMFLYMLGAFLLGLLLGWLLWGRLRLQLGELNDANARLLVENAQLKGELENCSKARVDLERRRRELDAELAELRSRSTRTATAAPAQLLSTPAAPSKTPVPDDLRKMIGIGPVNERLLHKAGVMTFAQIAAWTAADIKRIEEILQFDGRIERERWIEQAKLLAAGNEKEFLRRFPSAGTGNNT